MKKSNVSQAVESAIEQAKDDNKSLFSRILRSGHDLHEACMGFVGIPNGASILEGLIKFGRTKGGAARHMVNKQLYTMQVMFGFTLSSGDSKAKFETTRSPEFRARFTEKHDCFTALREYRENGFRDYTKITESEATEDAKNDKKDDPKTKCLKALGDWDYALLAFVQSHKKEIKALKEATKK